MFVTSSKCVFILYIACLLIKNKIKYLFSSVGDEKQWTNYDNLYAYIDIYYHELYTDYRGIFKRFRVFARYCDVPMYHVHRNIRSSCETKIIIKFKYVMGRTMRNDTKYIYVKLFTLTRRFYQKSPLNTVHATYH